MSNNRAAIDTLKNLGRALANSKAHPDVVEEIIENFVMLHYAKCPPRRNWARDNLKLFYQNHIDELNIFTGVKNATNT